jgi:hypothetical protein
MTDSFTSTDDVDTHDLERTLEAMRFVTPSFEDVRARQSTPTSGLAQRFRPLLLAAALVLVGGGLAFGASEMFPYVMGTPGVADCESWQCGDDFQVFAQYSGDPDSVEAWNVVVTDTVTDDRMATIAQALADRNRGYRVFVWFFSTAAGQERGGFPLMPDAGQTDISAPPPLNESAWRATYDFPASGADPVTQYGPGSAP